MDFYQLLDQAIKLHASGDLTAAERLYANILSADPSNFTALHFLGVLRAQQGRNSEAQRLIEAAIKSNPRSASALTNYGNVLIALGRHQDALESYNRALALQWDPVTLNGKATALQKLGRFDDALESYDRAIAAKPDYAEAHYNRGNILQALGRFDEAIASYDAILALDPGHADAWTNRGNVLAELRRYAEALESHDRARKSKPNDPRILGNRSIALWNMGHHAQALESADLALSIDPGLAFLWSHRGNVLRAMGRPDDALESFDRAISLDGGDAQSRLNKSYCLLLAGRWKEGWPLFEWRKRLPVPVESRNFAHPLWTGKEDLRGKILFCYAGQGLGDTVQFFRYCALLRERGAHVILAPQKSLMRLLGAADPCVTLIDENAVPEHFDYHSPLMSLPLAFGTTAETIPGGGAYLSAEPAKVREWGAAIGEGAFKIGISWRGNERGTIRGRSFPLSLFEKLARLPGIRLISLQKDATDAERDSVFPDLNIESLGGKFDNGPDAFVDSAAVIQNLDLVITADTAIAHIAGALGKQTWIALQHLPDWRWLSDRADTPWYRSVTLYRQPAPGDWPGVFDQMERALALLLADARN